MEACGDLNDALWIDATSQAIQTLKWMPKPAEFRAMVSHQLDKARKQKRRLEGLLEMARQPPRQTKFVPESEEVRTRGLRDSFRKVGDLYKAASYEWDLAKMESREMEEWAKAPDLVPRPQPPASAMPPREPIPQSLESKIGLLQARIKFFRDMGMLDYVSQMERELAGISGEEA